VLLLLVLRLLEGACVVTPLPTNNTKIEGAGKSKTKWGVMYLRVGFEVFFFLSHFLFLSLSRTETQEEVVEDS